MRDYLEFGRGFSAADTEEYGCIIERLAQDFEEAKCIHFPEWRGSPEIIGPLPAGSPIGHSFYGWVVEVPLSRVVISKAVA